MSRAIANSLSKMTPHRGRELRRLIEQLRIRSFGIDESDSGNSSKWLFERFKISRLLKFAIAGGNTKRRILKIITHSRTLHSLTHQQSCCGSE